MAQIPDIDVTTISTGGSAYTVPFLYQNRAEVFVEVDGVATAFTWINSGNISIVPAPAAGKKVRRYRSTSATAIRHDYRNGVPFTPKNIAENNDQILFIAQEAIETASQATTVAGGLSSDITAAIAAAAAAEASAANALATANGVDAKATSALSASATATGTANTALSTANTAKGIAEGIEGTALDAQSASNIAIATADNAFAKALTAEETANAIDAKAQDALDASVAAVNTAGAVDGKAQTALDNASTALSTANAAQATANAAAPKDDPAFTGRITESPVVTTTPSGTSYGIDLGAGTYQTFTNTASGAVLSVSGLAASALNQVTLEVVNGGAGTVAWPATTKWPGGTAPTLTASGTDIVQLLNPTGAAGAWYGYLVAKDVK